MKMKKAFPSTLSELLEAVSRGGFHACAMTDGDEDMSVNAAVDLLVSDTS